MNDNQTPLKGTARHVLVTSASRKAPLVRAMQDAVRRIHPEARVIAGDLDPEAPARYVADGFWQMPPVTDAELPALIQGCRERGITVVFPTRDGELAFGRATVQRSVKRESQSSFPTPRPLSVASINSLSLASANR